MLSELGPVESFIVGVLAGIGIGALSIVLIADIVARDAVRRAKLATLRLKTPARGKVKAAK